MIKTILVGLDGSEHAQTAIEYAFWLARRLDATAIGFHVVDVTAIEGSFLHDISGAMGFEPYLDFSARMRTALQERGKVLLQAFEEQARQRGVRNETLLGLGVVANEISERARLADLVVIGRRGVNDKFSTGLLGGTGESVARKCPRSVLMAPQSFAEPRDPLLAYDGSVRAAAAMQVAAELCTSLRLPLTVLTVHRDEEQGRRVLNEAASYLKAHELEARFELQHTGNAPERITNFLREKRHDLLFIGAYGHSRIIEMVLGSTTEYVLRNAHCPVFLNR